MGESRTPISDALLRQQKKQCRSKSRKMKKIGKSAKRFWKYLGETELAHQSKKSSKKEFRFENHRW